ncbi:ribonuclease D [Emcibacter sp.]|uniref:ribonuclease D n=1 Tax=Emcibacter sp. TaxID=1979954 RepID=UPI003A937A5B
MTVKLYHGDLPDDIKFSGPVAVDTETLGLKPHRDRLCLVQLSGGDGSAVLVQIAQDQTSAPNLKKLLENPGHVKIFHYARFDIAVLKHYLGINVRPLYCTKIASKLVRTYTDRHGLKDLCRELLQVEISKQQQSSNWGADELSQAQQEYAASDVLYLHRLMNRLDVMLERAGRRELARDCFEFLPTRADLDLAGWDDTDIFDHS